MVYIVHTLEQGTWARLTEEPSQDPVPLCACAPILDTHLQRQDNGWTLPRSIYKPANSDAIHLLMADLLDYGCKDCPIPNTNLQPWIVPSEEAQDAPRIEPAQGILFGAGELEPLDLVRIRLRWMRVASVGKRTYLLSWSNHCRALTRVAPHEIDEARRPERRIGARTLTPTS